MSATDRWRLLDEREFLTRSLADAEEEHGAGDLATADYEALRRRDEARLAAVEARLAESAPEAAVDGTGAGKGAAGPAPMEAAPDAALTGPKSRAKGSPTPPSRRRVRRNRLLAVVGVAAVVAAIVLLVIDLASPRLPGQPITGSVTLNSAKQVEEQLAQAADLVNEGTARSTDLALAVYREILSEDPHQPQALAETGWIEWQGGRAEHDTTLESAGRSLVEESIAVEHDDYAAHLYLGTIELEGGDPTGAVAQYTTFLAEDPPSSVLATAASLVRQAFTEAGRPVPGALTGSS